MKQPPDNYLSKQEGTLSRCWCPFKMSYVFEPTYGENVGAGLGGRLSVGSPVHPRYVRHLTQSIEIYKEADMKTIYD
jgi:hypothetical protein